MKSFVDKVFVITGAGSGIGLALAKALDAKGAKLALSDINEKALLQTANGLSQPPLTMTFSVADKAAWQVFKDTVIQTYERVDGIINNAGISHEAVGAEYLREADLNTIMDINFHGVVNGTQTFLPEIQKSPEGSIVNISSIFGITGIGLQSAYCASKFAVKGYTESLRMEALSYYPNLTVSVVHPGGIDTPIADNVISSGTRTLEEREADSRNFKKSFITPASKAAQVIVDGIKHKRARIVIGPDAKLLDFIARLMPVSYSKLILAQMKKRALVSKDIPLPLDKRKR
ncbi:SDR family oxidoreductase [Glaciecola sp. XM2]|uniref:SDR family NAD(P)-dependent oxidoreductase n=1 Tax=Glaciecola sp. XM2 TaxID=1914931 RepID=UPI001BDF4840|nr:SDR family oxidoreductase [Glaciecola sp. XM2]MBT1451255.1 SDR family oxidoreductase [Glaciecola sp. XM2]